MKGATELGEAFDVTRQEAEPISRNAQPARAPQCSKVPYEIVLKTQKGAPYGPSGTHSADWERYSNPSHELRKGRQQTPCVHIVVPAEGKTTSPSREGEILSPATFIHPRHPRDKVIDRRCAGFGEPHPGLDTSS